MASLVTSSPMGQLRPTTPCGTNDELSPMTGNETNVTGLGFPQYYKGAQIGFLVVLFFLIVIGNVVVLAAIAVNKERRKSRMNFFIMHLALSDLLTGPLVVLADLISKISIYWSAGNAVCRLHKFAQVVVMYSSTYLLVALSLDRLDAVARPLQFTSAWLRVKILVSLAWGLSLAFALPQLVLFHVHEIHGGPMCGLELSLSGWQIYLSLIAVSLFFIPALIILVCYLAIIVVIFNSSVQPISMKKAPKIKKRGNSADPVPEPTRELRSSSCTGGIINQAKIRTIKMTFLIVVVFILCWSPYFVFNLCQVYGALPATPRWAKITTFVQSLAPLNSAANPVIYGVFSTRICSYLRSSRGQQRTTRMSRPSLIQDSPQSGAFPGEYSSVTDTEDFRLTSDHRNINCDVTSSRVPLVDQSLTEADRQLLSLHVRGNTDMHEV